MFIFPGVKSIEILCILGIVAVIVNYLVSISFVPAALSLYAEVRHLNNKGVLNIFSVHDVYASNLQASLI